MSDDEPAAAQPEECVTAEAPAAPAEAAPAASREAPWDGVSLARWPELQQAAQLQLGEAPARTAAAVPALREMLSQLPEPQRPRDLSDAALLRALRARKFRVDLTYELLVAARKFELKHPGWFDDLRGEEFRSLYQAGFMRVLRGRDRVGRRVSLLLPSHFPDSVDANTLMRWNIWALGRMGRCPYFQVYGASIYENFTGFSFRQSLKLNAAMPPSVMHANFHYVQKCAAYRLGGIWVANQPAFMNLMWALVRPFMSAKMRGRVHLLGPELAAFATQMDAEQLPPEFGGSLQEDAMAWFDEQCALEAAGH